MFSFFRRRKDPAIAETPFTCLRDGLTIRGTMLRPAGDNLPVAIVSHGFMGNQASVRQYALPLAQLGYCVFIFDFCGGSAPGTGKSDGETTAMSVLTEAADLEAVMAYATAQPGVDASRLLLMGCSQGGFVSALAASRNPQKVQGLLLVYPALCIPDDARAGHMMFAHFDPANLPEVIPCGPMKLGRCYPADVLAMDPYQEIVAYPGRVLLVHGTKDTLVRPEYSQRAYEAYRATCPEGMPGEQRVQLRLIEGGAHGFAPRHDKIALGSIRDFARELMQ